MSRTQPLTQAEFDAVRKLLREHSAISLDAGKEYLVETRLVPLAKRLNLPSIGELLAQTARDPSKALLRQIIEAMVTTETLFFRDTYPFDGLRQVALPDLITRRRGERRLNIWCAASSSGQEPYSLAILLREAFPELAGWQVGFTASDISRDMLARSREGWYSQTEVNRGLPPALLANYFEADGGGWRVKAALREAIDFREINLATPWPTLPSMDVVLLRNVMIYFDIETKKSILERVAKLLRPDGYLLLGGAETTLNLSAAYRRVEPVKAGFYQLVE